MNISLKQDLKKDNDWYIGSQTADGKSSVSRRQIALQFAPRHYDFKLTLNKLTAVKSLPNAHIMSEFYDTGYMSAFIPSIAANGHRIYALGH